MKLFERILILKLLWPENIYVIAGILLVGGGPSGLSSEEFRKAYSGAFGMSLNERMRGRMGLVNILEDIEDPDEGGDQMEVDDEDQLEIWRLLPNLQHLPESMLKKLSLKTVFQLNMAMGKDKKNSMKLSANTRLSQTAARLARNPIQIEAGLDNRKNVMHYARFIGGTSATLTEVWNEARRVLGDDGVEAIGNYDLDSVGCGGCVTPKGWQELHNPSSQNLKLKLFYLPNVANSGLSAKKVSLDGEDEGLSIGESLKEIGDLDGYRQALNTAREAMHSAMPWNRSLSAITGFMMNTNFLQQDLGGNPRRAGILTEFTDYVLGRNGLNWENGHSFLTTDELAHVWSNWKGKRSALFAKREQKQMAKKKLDRGTTYGNSDVCKAYNVEKCKDQKLKECKTSWGKVLRHVCNKYTGANKQMCEKDHPRTEHK